MILSILKTALSTAGCNQIFYESDKLSGIITDQIKQNNIVGIIIQPNSMTFEPKANGIYHHYPPIMVEIMKQVKPEDTAENNEATLSSITDICDKFINALIKTQKFRKITSIIATKIQENRYDANVLGWALPLDLFHNESNKRC